MKRSGEGWSRLVPGRRRRAAADWRWVLAGVALALSCLSGIELLRSSDPPEGLAAALGREEKAPAGAVDLRDALGILQQKNLFEPAVPLPSRRVAKQSVDRIMGILSLNVILESGGGYVAYIHVKGFGLKRFREGEGIEEMFRVTRIQARRVELDVAGERMKLEL